MNSYTPSGIQQRLHSGENIIVHRSLLAEGRQLLFAAASYLGVHLIAYSMPELKWSIQLGSIAGHPVGLLFSPLELIPLLLLLWMLACVWDERYVIQRGSLLKIKGFMSFALSTTELYYDAVRTIQVEQTMYQQLLNLGDVRIGSLFAKNSDVVMRGVRDPYRYKALIERRMAAPRPKRPRRLRVRAGRFKSAAKRHSLQQFQ